MEEYEDDEEEDASLAEVYPVILVSVETTVDGGIIC